MTNASSERIYSLNQAELLLRGVNWSRNRAAQEFFLRDAPADETEAGDEPLSQHLHDVYHLFLYKLTSMMHQPGLSSQQQVQLRSLLEEILRAKLLLEHKGKN